jgi:hypothetical protein
MTQGAIVITKDRPREVARCLEAIAAQERAPNEIVVVDASQSKETRSIVADFATRHADLRVTCIDAAPNICEQKNIGLARCSADIVSFFDDDVVIPPEYCLRVRERFARDLDGTLHGLAGLPVRMRLDAWPLFVFRKLFLLQTNRGRNRFRVSGFPDFGFRFEGETEVEFLASTAVSFRRSAIGGLRFDTKGLTGEALGLASGRGFAEDVLFSNAARRGGTLLLLPLLRFEHTESTSARESTFVTQALYVMAMRRVSAAHATTTLRRAARLWALAGTALLCLAQSCRYRDSGYLRGYVRAMRAR